MYALRLDCYYRSLMRSIHHTGVVNGNKCPDTSCVMDIEYYNFGLTLI